MRLHRLRSVLCLLLLLGSWLLSPTLAHSRDVSLAWDRSASDVGDGTYRVYWGNATSTYPNVFEAGNVTQVEIESLADGSDWYFAATYGDYRGESGYSNEVFVLAQQQTVASATDIVVTWQQEILPMTVILSESFEGAGYDDANWTEYIGGTSETIDEDSAGPGSLPTGGGSQCLYVENVGRYYGAPYVQNTLGSQEDILEHWGRIYVWVDTIDASRFADNENVIFARVVGTRNHPTIGIVRTSGSYYFRMGYYDATSYVVAYITASTALNTGQWYRLEWHYKFGAIGVGIAEFRIDGADIGSVNTVAISGDLDSFQIGLPANNASAEMSLYFDLVKLTDEGWIGAEATLKSLTDSGSGSDAIAAVLASLGLTDSGSGADSSGGVAAQLPALPDSGAGVDALAQLLASLSIDDSGAGADILSQILAALAVVDTGTGSDVMGPVTVSFAAADSGVGVDVKTVITDTIKSLVDSGVGADAIAQVLASLSVADAGTGTDDQVMAISFALADIAVGGDAIASLVKGVLVALNDAGIGSDAVGPFTVGVPIADAASGFDGITITESGITLDELSAKIDGMIITLGLVQNQVDAIFSKLSGAVTGGMDWQAVLRIILAAMSGRTTGIGTTSEQYKSVDGIKDRIDAIFDDDGNRVSVALDGSE